MICYYIDYLYLYKFFLYKNIFVRYVVLDVETTGLNIKYGHRVIQLACVEIINGVITGNNLNLYVNPEFPVSSSAFKIHGISDNFLLNKPKFSDIVDKLLKFLGDSVIVAHNAFFDRKFLFYELRRVGKFKKYRFIDTLAVSRKIFLNKSNKLEFIAKYLGVLNFSVFHDAYNDAIVLAKCFIIFLKQKIIK